MMMVDADEGSPAKVNKEDSEMNNDDSLDLEELWAMLDNSPQDNAMDNLRFTDALTGLETPEDFGWAGETAGPGQHKFEGSECSGAGSDGFLESAWGQGNDFFYTHELLLPQDNIGASESRIGHSDVPAWESSFPYGEMLEFPFETPDHGELFNLNGANHDIHNQQYSDKNGWNKAPFETPNYGNTPCSLGLNNMQVSYPNHEDYPVGITEFNPGPATGTESKKPSNASLNKYRKVKVQSKVEKNVDLRISSNSVRRASKVVDGAIYGGPSEPSISENEKSSSSRCMPLVSCRKYDLHSEDETQDGILESRRTLPSLSKAGGTTNKIAFVAAHDRHPGVLAPPSFKMENKMLKMETEVSKINNPGVQNIEDDPELCVLEDMSAPARSNHVAKNVKLVTAKQNSTSGTQTVTTHAKRRPNNERVIYRAALQDLSQPKLEATLPDGVLSVPLLKHQRIALYWMANKETRSACCSGGILADDQGLGKTISTIALILKERSPSSRAPKNNEKQSETETLNLDDDMDDGVTCQINEYSRQAKGRPSGGTLVVCPTSVLRQWSEELHTKVTKEADLSVLVYYGGNRTKDPVELAKYDVVVTTYAIVSMEVPKQPVVNDNDDQRGSLSYCGKRKISDRKNKKGKKGMESEIGENVCGPLAQVGWFRVVLDEAQSIKNHRTQAARACWGLRAKRRWCLSGTPIQNAIDDLYSYFRFLRHEPYAVFRTFCDKLKHPIQKNPRTGYQKLQAVLKTIMLRRTKGTLIGGEPIINLPPKIIQLKKIEFSNDERNFYSRLEAQSRAQFAEYAAAGTVKQNYVNLLLMLLRLRQACDHPLLVKGFNSNSKMATSVEMAKNLSQEKQSFLLSCLEASLAICGICNDPPEDGVVTVCGHLFCNQCICERITGDDTQCPTKKCKTHLTKSSVFSVNTLRIALSDDMSIENTANCANSEVSEPATLRCPQDSSKIKAALDLLKSLSKPRDNIKESYGSKKLNVDSNVKRVGEKAIVFSQWTGMLDLLEACLKSNSIEYRRLDGTMPVGARDKAVKDFNSLPEVCVIIMSLKAASLGLNMVAACNVVLLDLWWNPTTEDQAIDRAHRIGQTRPVSVYRLTVKDTVEDRILALQQKKRKMVAYAFGDDDSGGRQSRLTVEDLKYLFKAD